MRLKKCLKCGKLFNTAKNEQALCDDCVAAGRATTIRPRTCRECGAIFDGGPRAWYCPSCRAVRRKEAAARYRKNGVDRPLGSIDYCTVCGKAYVVKSGRQRYCPECADDAVRQQDRMASKEWNAENNFYDRTPLERSGQKVCVICGKPVLPGTPRITCSDECDRLRKKKIRSEADFKRGKQKSTLNINRINKQGAEDIVPPEVIDSLMDDIRSVIARCADCGDWFVKTGAASKLCKKCSKNHRLEYMREYAREKSKERGKDPKNSEAKKQYQAEYYRKNKERIQAQRKARKQK